MHCEYCVNKPREAGYTIGGLHNICKHCIDSTFLQKLYNKWEGQSIVAIQGKKVNRHNLPIDHKYKVIGFDYCGSILDGGGSTCDNCNRVIVNIATIKRDDDKVYNVGLDCAETLSLVDTSDFWKIKEEEARARKILSWVRNVKNKQKSGVVCKYEVWENCIVIYTDSVCWNYRVTKPVFEKYFSRLGLTEKIKS